jgi:hypothetical protein
MAIHRLRPPNVYQFFENSCWAAVLESWSRVDARLGQQDQADLIARWGEGDTAMITPERKIPIIAQTLVLMYDPLRSGRQLDSYFRRYLPNSHIFFAYTVSSGFIHSVLVYGLDGDDLYVMDPGPGWHRRRSLDWLKTREPFVVMRSP